MSPSFSVHRRVLPTERTLLHGIAVARWGVVAWQTITVIAQRRDLAHPWLAVGVLGVLVAMAAWSSLTLRRDPSELLRLPLVAIESLLALVALTVDGWAYRSPHAFASGQNLAGSYPLVATIAAGPVIGPWPAAGVGALLSTGRLWGAFANGYTSLRTADVLSVVATAVFYALAGFVFGLVARLLRRVETEVLTVRAREEVARTLHDGVLQTLALVAHRTFTTDPELAAVARQSDRDLRAWLFGAASQTEDRADLAARLRRAGAAFSKRFDQRVTVSALDEGCRADDRVLAALESAVGEALNNAGKHAEASAVTIFAETDDDGEVFCSVRDDGRGFDPASAVGFGIARSIVERMREVGGRAEVVSRPGEGTEVRLWTR